jgi:hypothetical protein
MPYIGASPKVLKKGSCQFGQAKNFIQLPEKQQAPVTGYPGAVKFQLHGGIKLEPQTPVFSLTQQIARFHPFKSLFHPLL